MSNLSHDHVNKDRQTDLAKKTIEQPTDVDDAQEYLDDPSDFDHVNNQSPDIRLKSIDIDDTFTANRQKANDQFDDVEADDNSGTGHKAQKTKSTSKQTNKSSLIMQNSYGSETYGSN